MPPDDKIARARLIVRKQELQSLSDSSVAARDTVTLDQQSVGRLSRMDAMQQQAMAQATERQRGNELVRINQAMNRLDAGDYGYCDECGEEIAAKRLEIDPAANLCVRCASR